MRAILLDPSNGEFFHALSYSFQLMGKLEKALYCSHISSVVFQGLGFNNHIMWETLFSIGNKKEAWKYWETRFETTNTPKKRNISSIYLPPVLDTTPFSNRQNTRK